MSNEFWVVDKEKTKEYWLELNDPEGFYSCVINWDGSMHYNDYGCVPRMETKEDRDKMEQYYYGDIIEHYHRVKALYEIAVKHFKDNYPHDWEGAN